MSQVAIPGQATHSFTETLYQNMPSMNGIFGQATGVAASALQGIASSYGSAIEHYGFAPVATATVLGLGLIYLGYRRFRAVNPNIRDRSGQTALYKACEKMDLAQVEKLLANRTINIEIPENGTLNTPKHIVAKRIDTLVKIYIKLLEKKKDVSVGNIDQETPDFLLDTTNLLKLEELIKQARG